MGLEADGASPQGGKTVGAARAGFAARGFLYILIGWLAVHGRAEDPRGALAYLSQEVGTPILVLLGLGFAFYGGWRLLEAWTDTQGRGNEPKGLAVRFGGAVCGLVYLGFAAATVKIVLAKGGGGSSPAEKGASTALDLPGGPWLLRAVAAAFLVAAIVQFAKGVKLGFLKHVTGEAARSAWVKWCGRLGLFARGGVFATVAWLMWRAAADLSPSEAGGSGDALATMPLPMRIAIGAGLVLFGLFSLVEARYRRIANPARGA